MFGGLFGKLLLGALGTLVLSAVLDKDNGENNKVKDDTFASPYIVSHLLTNSLSKRTVFRKPLSLFSICILLLKHGVVHTVKALILLLFFQSFTQFQCEQVFMTPLCNTNSGL